MSVGIYRNMLDGELKNFSKFSKEIPKLCDLDLCDIEIVYESKKSLAFEKLINHNTVVFITHGDHNTLYHRYYPESKRQPLVELRDINPDGELKDFFNGKVIIAFSCGTGMNLGKKIFDNTECRAYFGFKHKIHFDRKDAITGTLRYSEFLKKCYKTIFRTMIVNAINDGWSIEEFDERFRRYAKKHITKEALNLKLTRPNFYHNHGIAYAILAVTHVSDSAVLYHDGNPRLV